ncbi:unnamed protein product [Caenorhabditis nigoni]
MTYFFFFCSCTGALLFSAPSPIFIFFISLSVIGRTSPVGSSRPETGPDSSSVDTHTALFEWFALRFL